MPLNKLSATDRAHADEVIAHINTRSTSEQATLKSHADNDDHDMVVAHVKDYAEAIGLTISIPAAMGTGWWLIKHWKK